MTLKPGPDQALLCGDETRSAPKSAADFETWVAPHLAVMTAVAAGQVPSADVDDVVQDALVRAWRRRATFDDRRGTPRAWLLGVLLDQTRRSRTRRRVALPTDNLVVVAGDSDTVSRLHIEQAISQLPRRQREVIVLHYLADLKLDEVARALGVSTGTVKSTLFDARHTLRSLLEDQ